MPFCLADENVIGKGLLKRDVTYKMFTVLCLYLSALVCDRNKAVTFKTQLSLSENIYRIFR